METESWKSRGGGKGWGEVLRLELTRQEEMEGLGIKGEDGQNEQISMEMKREIEGMTGCMGGIYSMEFKVFEKEQNESVERFEIRELWMPNAYMQYANVQFSELWMRLITSNDGYYSHFSSAFPENLYDKNFLSAKAQLTFFFVPTFSSSLAFSYALNTLNMFDTTIWKESYDSVSL